MNEDYSYWFLTGVLDISTNKVYFFGNNFKGFFLWNMKKNNIKLLDSISKCSFENEMYDCGVIANGRIYFPPRNTDKMAIYDIFHKKLFFKELYLENIKEEINFRPSVLGHFAIKGRCGKIYFIYRENPAITCYDLEKKEVKYILPINKKRPSKYIMGNKESETMILSKGYTEKDGVYYFPASNRSCMLVFDSNNETVRRVTLSKTIQQGYSSCIVDGDEIVLLSNDSHIILKWNLKNHLITIIHVALKNKNICERCLIKKHRNYYIILPMLDIDNKGKMSQSYIINKNTGMVIRAYETFKEYSIMKKWNVMSTCGYEWYIFYEGTYGDRADAYWARNLVFGRVNINTMKFETINFPIPDGWTQEMISKKIIRLQSYLNFKAYSTTYENKRVGLNQLIDEIENRK